MARKLMICCVLTSTSRSNCILGSMVEMPLRHPDSQFRSRTHPMATRSPVPRITPSRPIATPFTTSPHVRNPPLPMKVTQSLRPSSISFSWQIGMAYSMCIPIWPLMMSGAAPVPPRGPSSQISISMSLSFAIRVRPEKINSMSGEGETLMQMVVRRLIIRTASMKALTSSME